MMEESLPIIEDGPSESMQVIDDLPVINDTQSDDSIPFIDDLPVIDDQIQSGSSPVRQGNDIETILKNASRLAQIGGYVGGQNKTDQAEFDIPKSWYSNEPRAEIRQAPDPEDRNRMKDLMGIDRRSPEEQARDYARENPIATTLFNAPVVEMFNDTPVAGVVKPIANAIHLSLNKQKYFNPATGMRTGKLTPTEIMDISQKSGMYALENKYLNTLLAKVPGFVLGGDAALLSSGPEGFAVADLAHQLGAAAMAESSGEKYSFNPESLGQSLVTGYVLHKIPIPKSLTKEEGGIIKRFAREQGRAAFQAAEWAGLQYGFTGEADPFKDYLFMAALGMPRLIKQIQAGRLQATLQKDLNMKPQEAANLANSYFSENADLAAQAGQAVDGLLKDGPTKQAFAEAQRLRNEIRKAEAAQGAEWKELVRRAKGGDAEAKAELLKRTVGNVTEAAGPIQAQPEMRRESGLLPSVAGNLKPGEQMAAPGMIVDRQATQPAARDEGEQANINPNDVPGGIKLVGPESGMQPVELVVNSEGRPSVVKWTKLTDISRKQDVEQFKEGADANGVVEPLQGKYNLEPFNPIVLWRRNNGELQVVTGRHRLDLARRTGLPEIPSHVFKEADGYDENWAYLVDAISNIRDGQGKVSDYAKFFRKTNIDRATSKEQGLLRQAKGRIGFGIGKDTSDDLFALYAAGKISEAKAYAIAQAAPGNESLQAIGIGYAKNHTPEEVADYIKAIQSIKPDSSSGETDLDLFGKDQTWQIQAELLGKAARGIQARLVEEQQAIRAGLAVSKEKRSKELSKYGIKTGDTEALKVRMDQLAQEIVAWENWHTDPAKMQIVRGVAGLNEGGNAVRETAVAYQTEMFGAVATESPLHFQLRTISESRKGAPATSDNVQSLATRELQNKATSLLDALDGGRLTEVEANQRWLKAQEQTGRVLSRFERESAAKAKRETMSLFGEDKMLFEGGPEYANQVLERFSKSRNISPEGQQQLALQLEVVSSLRGNSYYEPEPSQAKGQSAETGPDQIRINRQAEKNALLRPTAENFEAAFKETDRVSSLIQRYVSNQINFEPMKGKIIKDSADFAAAVMVARSPLVESFVIGWLDKDGRVISIDVAMTGILDASLIDERSLLSLMPEGAVSCYVSHNHPSGDPSPSSQDLDVYKKMGKHLEAAGIRMIDGVITNGGSYYSSRDNAVLERDQMHVADWELFPRGKTELIRGPENLSDIVTALRKADANYGHVIFLSTRNRITAIHRLPVTEMMERERLIKYTTTMAAKEGAAAVLYDFPVRDQDVEKVFSDASVRNALGGVSLLDIASMETPTMRESGALKIWEQSGLYQNLEAPQPNSVREVGEGYSPNPAEEIYKPGDNRPVPIKDDPTFSVFPMQLPEGVMLAEGLLGGRNINIKRSLGNAAGYFKAGKMIALRSDLANLVSKAERIKVKQWAAEQHPDPKEQKRIYDEAITKMEEKAYQETGPRYALKVLFHEIGHAADWFPQGMVRGRGNIFGHVAAFVRYTKQMLAKLPEDQQNLITDKDRARIRKESQKSGIPYADLIQREIAARGLVTREQIIKELEPLIAWYNGAEEIPAYYTTSSEMYADAMSVFLNNPAATKARAPIFWELVHNWMEERPQFKQEYDAIQHIIATGGRQNVRRQRIWDMFKRSDSVMRWTEDQRKNVTFNEKLDQFSVFFDSKYGPWQRRLKKLKTSGAAEALAAIDLYQYKGSMVQAYLARNQQIVIDPLLEAGIPYYILGEYAFYKRILNDRKNIFNPLGFDPPAAQKGLDEMRESLGDEKFNMLESAAAQMRKIFDQDVLAPAREFEIFDPETQKYLEDNINYTTFSVQKGSIKEGQSSLETMIENKYGGGISSKLFKQEGTVSDIENPVTATLAKGMTLISMVHLEHAKRLAVEEILKSPFANEWSEADYKFNGKANVPVIVENDRIGTLLYLHKGEIRAYYGPKLMVQAFESMNPIETQLVLRGMNWVASHLKDLWTRLNPGFWPVAHLRDIQRVNAMPGAISQARSWVPLSFGVFSKHARRAYRAAWSAQIQKNPNADAIELMRRGMIISRAEGYRGEGAEDNRAVVLMKRYGVRPKALSEPNADVKDDGFLSKFWEDYTHMGPVAEFAAKAVATWHIDERFPNWSEGQKRMTVHELGGSPNFLNKPNATGSAFMQTMILFYNPWKEGLRSEKHYWQNSPGERALNIVRWVMLPAAALAAFAYSRKDLYQSIPERDRRSYSSVPLGWADKEAKKVAYLRLPWEENNRLYHIVLSALIESAVDKDMKAMTGITDFEGQQLPGINPITKLGFDWLTYANGGVPTDVYGNKVLTRDQQIVNEGDPTSFAGEAAMLRHTWNQTLASMFGRIDNRDNLVPESGRFERFLNTPGIKNTIGRFIKVSDAGYRESQLAMATPVAVEEAKIRMQVRDMVKDMSAGKVNEEIQAIVLAGMALENTYHDAPLPTEMALKRYAWRYYKSIQRDQAIQNMPADTKVMLEAPSKIQRQEMILGR